MNKENFLPIPLRAVYTMNTIQKLKSYTNKNRINLCRSPTQKLYPKVWDCYRAFQETLRMIGGQLQTYFLGNIVPIEQHQLTQYSSKLPEQLKK
jgi:hypothetical protein